MSGAVAAAAKLVSGKRMCARTCRAGEWEEDVCTQLRMILAHVIAGNGTARSGPDFLCNVDGGIV